MEKIILSCHLQESLKLVKIKRTGLLFLECNFCRIARAAGGAVWDEHSVPPSEALFGDSSLPGLLAVVTVQL